MSNPWLTLITVTKDDPPGLRRTLASAATLRAAGAEHLVIDGSTVASAGSRPMENVSGVTFHVREARGIADAFNTGVSLARSEWVWFLNGGDAVHEALDGAWLRVLLATTRAPVVTGAVQYDGESTVRCPPPLSEQWPLLTCWLAHPATILRRNMLLRSGGFDVGLVIAMDYDLWHRVLRSPTAVDVVAIPFARFDIKGVSQRHELRAVVRREEAIVVLRHAATLSGAALETGWRLVRRLAWAVVRRVRS